MGGMNLENILQITSDLGLILTPTHFSLLKCSFLVRTYDPYVHLFFQSAMLIIGLSAPNLTQKIDAIRVGICQILFWEFPPSAHF